jgi:hypothetical protein
VPSDLLPIGSFASRCRMRTTCMPTAKTLTRIATPPTTSAPTSTATATSRTSGETMDPRAAVTAPGRRAGDGPAASTSSRSRPHPVVFVDRRYSSLGLKGSPLYTYEHVVDHHDDDATRFLYRAQSAVLRRARNVPEHRVLALVHVRDELRADGVSWMRQGSTVPTRPRLCGHLPVPGLVPLLRALPVGPEPRQSGAEKTAGHSQHRDRSLLGHAQRRRRHRRDRSTFRSMSVPASSRGSGKGCRCGRSHCGAAAR